jgi:hypothetical protein
MTPFPIHSMRSHSGGPLGTHSYHSLLGFACSLLRHRRPVLVGSRCLVISRGPCCSLQLPRTLCSFVRFTWLDSHGLFSLIHSSGPSGSCSTPRFILFTWLVDRPLDWTPTDYRFIQFTFRVACTVNAPTAPTDF